MAILIFVVFLLFIAVAAFFSHRAAQKRRQELAALAQQLAWRFYPDREYQHEDRYPQFGVFRQGSSRYAYNTLRGSAQVQGVDSTVVMGDYHYATKSTNSKGRSTTHHHHFSYLLMAVPVPGAPDLAIRPEGFFDKLGGFLGFDDIDFESAEFSRAFHVKSSDKRFAYDVIHPRMMEFLLANRGPAISLESGFCCLSAGRCWEAAQFAAHLDWLTQFFELWPDHVTADLHSRARR